MRVTTFLRQKLFGLTSSLQFDNGLLILIQRTFFRKVPLAVYQKNGLTFVVDFEGNDHNGIRHCLTSDMYPRYFRNIERRPLTVLDLGANTGGFVFALRAAGFEFGQAVSVEMNPNTYHRLCFNVSYNRLPNIKTMNAAVWDREGSVSIADSQGDPGQSIYNTVDSARAVSVPTATFDSIVSANFPGEGDLDLVKMDIEIAEYVVLFSETCQSLRRFRNFIIEIHPNEKTSVADLIRRIESFGFENVTDPDGIEKDVFCFQRRAERS